MKIKITRNEKKTVEVEVESPFYFEGGISDEIHYVGKIDFELNLVYQIFEKNKSWRNTEANYEVRIDEYSSGYNCYLDDHHKSSEKEYEDFLIKAKNFICKF